MNIEYRKTNIVYLNVICQLQELGVFMYHNKTQNRRLPYANEFALIKKRFQGELGVQRHETIIYISNKHNLDIRLRVSHIVERVLYIYCRKEKRL